MAKRSTPDYNAQLPEFLNPRKQLVTITFANVGAAASVFINFPFRCIIHKITSVLQSAITTADAVLTAKNHAGTAMATGAITIAFTGSAAGTIDSVTPTTNNVVNENENIEIANDGGATGTGKCYVQVYYEKLNDQSNL